MFLSAVWEAQINKGSIDKPNGERRRLEKKARLGQRPGLEVIDHRSAESTCLG